MTFPTLHLTSPHMKGDVVKEAQTILNGHNRWKWDTLPGKIDGEYGPISGSAAMRMKIKLGYPKAKQNTQFGANLFGYLVPKGVDGYLPLPKSYRLRQLLRRESVRKAERNAGFRRAVLAKAHTQVGVKESPPESNRVKYSEWYGVIGAWCAMFVSWLIAQLGQGGKFRYAYCPYIWADAIDNRNGLSAVGDPMPGDLVLYHFGSGIAKHVGVFDHWIDRKAGTFEDVEGNTGKLSQDNGGEVQDRSDRTTSLVLGFVRYTIY